MIQSELYGNIQQFVRERIQINDLYGTQLAVSAYPNSINAANISRETTSKEIIDIEGLDREDYMNQNINAIFGRVNSVEYCCTMLNFPTFEEIKNKIKKEG